MPLVTYTANEMGLQAEGGLVKEWHVPLKHLVLKAKPLCTVQIQGGCIVLYAQEDMIITDIYCDVGNTFATHMPLFTGNIFKGQTDQLRPAKDTPNLSTAYRNAGAGKVEVVGLTINDIRLSGDKVSSDTTYSIVGNGEKEVFVAPSSSTTARDTSYRVQSRLRKEYLNALGTDLDNSPISNLNSSSRPDTNHQDQQTGCSNTTYRNAGAGKVEVAGSVVNDVRSPINTDSQSKQPIQQPISSTSTPNKNKRDQETSATNTAYRNAGSGIVEVVGTVTSDKRSTVGANRSNTTYRNAGAGQVEITRASSIDPQSHAEASNSNRRSNQQPIANNSRPPTNKRFAFKTSVSHFDYGKLMHWTKKTGSKYLADEVICEITCFTSRDGAPHTEFIRAPIEVVLKEKLVTVNDRIEKGMPLFRYQELVEVKEWEQGKSERLNNKQQTTNTTCTRTEASNSNRRSNQQLIANNSRPPTNKRFTFKTSASHFDYGKLMHWTKKTGSKYLANDVVCEVTCFTSSNGVPHTEYIRAPIELVLKEKLVTVNDHIKKGVPLFRYQELVNSGQCEKDTLESSKSSQKTSATASNQIQSVQSNVGFIHTAPSIEYLDEIIELVTNGHSFQFRNVLETIITTERERINDERAFWKLGAGVVTLISGGLIDGFGMSDLFFSLGMSNVAGMAHQLASKEQVEFLKKMQSEWLVLERSPIDIRRRLGEPQGRFIGMSRDNICDAFNIHQSGSRGFHLVDLDFTSNAAEGFNDSQFREVLQRSFDEEDIESLATQLYPGTITPLRMCRTITPEEARKKDPYYSQLSKVGAPFRVVYSDDTEGIMYKIQIPHHSDY